MFTPRRVAWIALMLALMLLFSPLARAQDRFEHLGARASAMGGAFTAVADDATAFHWNPAGYAFGPIVQAGFQWGETQMDRGDLLGGLSLADGAGSLYHQRLSGFSFGYTFMGVAGTFARRAYTRRDEDLATSSGLRTFDLAVSLLYSLPVDNLVVATNLHYLRGETHELVEPVSALAASGSSPADASSIADRLFRTEGLKSSTATLDLAALYEPARWFRAGLMWRRLTEPAFRAPSGEEIRLPREARAGVAFSLPQSALVSFDVDLSRQGAPEDGWREISLGGEKKFFEDAVSLRAGLRAEVGSSSGARPAFTAGAGAKVRFVLAEVAYVASSGGRDESWWFSITVRP